MRRIVRGHAPIWVREKLVDQKTVFTILSAPFMRTYRLHITEGPYDIENAVNNLLSLRFFDSTPGMDYLISDS